MTSDGDPPPLSPDLLLHGYSIGIFPMAETRDDQEVFWVDPRKRGVLPLDGFHMSRSLRRTMRRPQYAATLDACFDQVLEGCANRAETWINAPIADIYKALHRRRQAHSLEIWHDGELVGGVYGVAIGSAFFGESMFSNRRDGSKIALACLISHLKRCGFTLFDTQFVTEHLLSLGAEEISRAVYHQRLQAALAQAAQITRHPVPQPQDVAKQRMTQTS